MSQLQIRPATPDDASAIATIFNSYIALAYYTLEQIDWTEHSVAASIDVQDPRELFLVAELASEIKAWASIKKYSDRHGYRATCVTSLFVSQNAKGQGIGGQLIEQLYEACRQLGYHHLCAKIIARNQDSINFHRRFGYELVGIQKQAGLINDEWVDVALMQKILD